MFEANTYQARRKQLQAQLSSGLVLFLGNEEAGMNYKDNTYPFRQDSTFLYYFGLDNAGLAAIIDLDEEKSTIYGYDFTMDDVVWMGPQPSLADRAARAGVHRTAALSHLEAALRKAQEQGRDIHFLPPYRPEGQLKLQKLLGVNPDQASELASVALIKAVVAQRSYKSEEEVAEINKAVNTTAAMHTRAMQMARPGMVESEVAGAIEGIALSDGGRLSFPAIVTINGQTLHNHYHGNTLEKGQLMLVDSGAEAISHYAGDMTRTFPVSKKFSTRQREIYEIVLKSNMDAIAALKPGVPYRDIHLLSARVIAQGLKDLNLMKGNVDEAVAAGAHALFYPHGLGHMMGLDVHDMENLGENYVGYTDTLTRSTQFGLSALRLGRALEPGFVLTVEPGIYFIPELIDLWKAEGKHSDFLNFSVIDTYKDFGGVRIEDDYLITDDGAKLLGKPVAKTIEEVEALRS